MYRIKTISRNRNKRDGSPYVGKNGQAQQRVSMLLEGVDGYVSFFDRVPGEWDHLVDGATIEGAVQESGKFKNFVFSKPPSEQPAATPAPASTPQSMDLSRTNELLEAIYDLLSQIKDSNLPF